MGAIRFSERRLKGPQDMNEFPRPRTHSSHDRARSIDRFAWRVGCSAVLVVALGGCTSLAPQQPTAAAPSPMQPQCAGKIEPPYGLTVISDPTLLAKTVS